ncbi:hypothetical protein CBM2606_A40058 [Cupriavidus taiwanensis]|nr:hypothetical protein CBM2606_A40058 [Cupriavidus taiwanensis]
MLHGRFGCRLVALQRAGNHTALAESRRIVDILIVRYR